MDGVIYYGDSHPVPVIPSILRQSYLKLVHEHAASGHFGRDKTLARAQQFAWWPTIQQDTIDFFKNCETCQRFKTPTRKYGELQPIEVGKAGDLWAMDVAVLPTSQRGNRYLLVAWNI